MWCLSSGFSMNDIRTLKIGTLFSLLEAKNNLYKSSKQSSKEDDVREATQADIDFLAR